MGIQGVELEQVEMQLRADILRKAFIHQEGVFEYYCQDKDMKNQLITEKVTRQSILCLHEIYTEICKRYSIKYYRIPVTDESEPESQDFDSLLGIFIKSQ